MTTFHALLFLLFGAVVILATYYIAYIRILRTTHWWDIDKHLPPLSKKVCLRYGQRVLTARFFQAKSESTEILCYVFEKDAVYDRDSWQKEGIHYWSLEPANFIKAL